MQEKARAAATVAKTRRPPPRKKTTLRKIHRRTHPRIRETIRKRIPEAKSRPPRKPKRQRKKSPRNPQARDSSARSNQVRVVTAPPCPSLPKPIREAPNAIRDAVPEAPSQFQSLQIASKIRSKLRILQCQLHGSLQNTTLIPGVIRYALVDVSPESMFLRQEPQSIGQLDLPTSSRFRTRQAFENRRGQNIPPGDRQIRRCIRRLRLLHQVPYPQHARPKR